MIPNEEKEGKQNYLAVKKLSALLYRITKDIHQQQKICEYIPCGYSMSVNWAFDHIESRYNLYR